MNIEKIETKAKPKLGDEGLMLPRRCGKTTAHQSHKLSQWCVVENPMVGGFFSFSEFNLVQKMIYSCLMHCLDLY